MKSKSAPPSPALSFHAAYVSTLEKGLFPEGVQPPRVRALARGVMSLWERFNAKRDKLERGYMADDADLEAYIAAFQLPNVERVRGLCRRYFTFEAADSIANPKQSAAKQPAAKPLRILDFGSGPLSASAGFLAFLEEMGPLPAHVEITAVDLSGAAISLGTTVLQDALVARGAKASSVTITVKRFPEKDTLPRGAFDVVLAANVLNEILPASRAGTLAKLAGACAPGGTLLVLEPGQDVHSRSLAAARDAFLLAPAARAFDVIAPCPHRRACPLGPEKGRKDWCWFRHNWHPPAFLAELDRASGLDHAELAYSFLLLRARTAKVGAPLETKSTPAKKNIVLPEAAKLVVVPHARVVSDDIPLPKDPDVRERARTYVARNVVGAVDPKKAQALLDDEATRKILLCTHEGLLEGLYAADRRERKTRGSDMRLVPGQLRAREGSNTKNNAVNTRTGERDEEDVAERASVRRPEAPRVRKADDQRPQRPAKPASTQPQGLRGTRKLTRKVTRKT